MVPTALQSGSPRECRHSITPLANVGDYKRQSLGALHVGNRVGYRVGAGRCRSTASVTRAALLAELHGVFDLERGVWPYPAL